MWLQCQGGGGPMAKGPGWLRPHPVHLPSFRPALTLAPQARVPDNKPRWLCLSAPPALPYCPAPHTQARVTRDGGRPVAPPAGLAAHGDPDGAPAAAWLTAAAGPGVLLPGARVRQPVPLPAPARCEYHRQACQVHAAPPPQCSSGQVLPGRLVLVLFEVQAPRQGHLRHLAPRVMGARFVLLLCCMSLATAQVCLCAWSIHEQGLFHRAPPPCRGPSPPLASWQALLQKLPPSSSPRQVRGCMSAIHETCVYVVGS